MLKKSRKSKSNFHYVAQLLVVALLISAVVPVVFGSTPVQANDGLLEWKGKVTTMPAGKIGDWVIGGKTFTANVDTEFDEVEGVLDVGVCAKVDYKTVNGTFIAHEIDSEPAGDCDGNGNDDDDDDDDDLKHYGRLDEMPSGGRDGDWVIGGVRFQATSNTEFNPEHGAFQLGACVKVESEAATPRVAKEIETEHQYRCMGDGTEPPKAEMYGVVTEFPDDLIGKWVIGGMEFIADATTEFEQERGEFAVGATVKVKFYTDSDDVNHALEIETKYAANNDDDDDDEQERHRERHGQDGHVFGVIEELPQAQSLLGDWTIGGMVYVVNDETDLEDDSEDYLVGTRVRVEYYLDSSDSRIAEEIKVTDDKGDVKDDDHTKLLGFVEKMPASGFIGAWMIAGAEFMVNGDTELKEDHGLFGTGAYVEVEYSIVGNHRIIHEMETQVPPGAGDDTNAGTIDSVDEAMQTASIQVAGANQWIVGGKAYSVIPATQIDDSAGDLAVGNTAIVNSYIANDGRAVATSIQGITLDNQVFMPLAVR